MTCPHWDCANRTEYGYCRFTVCCNPKYISFMDTTNEGEKMKLDFEDERPIAIPTIPSKKRSRDANYLHRLLICKYGNEDCFAYHDERCVCLIEQPKNEECPFYKTNDKIDNITRYLIREAVSHVEND